MTLRLRFAVLCVLMAGLIGCQTPPQTVPGPGVALASSSPWRTIVVGAGSEPERLALIDLQRYIAQVTGDVPALITPAAWQKHARPAIIGWHTAIEPDPGIACPGPTRAGAARLPPGQ